MSGYLFAALSITAGWFSGASAAPPKIVGSSTCGQSTCHAAPQPWLGSIVEQNEYRLWHEKDPHRQSGLALESERARSITQRLGLGSASDQSLCKSCHAPISTAANPIQEGVGCEACHGAAKPWLGVHTSGTASHAEILNAGLRPLEKPVVQAELCLSCHAYDGKRITHRLLAAGHPRLETDYAKLHSQWPKHHVVDADYQSRKRPATEAKYHQAGHAGVARQWIHGLVQTESERGAGLPELSFFDCRSCHRDMNSRGRALKGTPNLNTRALGAIATNDAELKRRIRALEASVSGDRAGFIQSAQRLAAHPALK